MEHSQANLNWTDIIQLASKFDYFLLDCDGVVWQANNQIGTAFKTVEWLQAQGKKVYFLSNNSTKSPETMALKMKSMGLSDPQLDKIYGSAFTLA